MRKYPNQFAFIRSLRKHVLLYGFYDVVAEEDAEVTEQLSAAFAEWTESAKITRKCADGNVASIDTV